MSVLLDTVPLALLCNSDRLGSRLHEERRVCKDTQPFFLWHLSDDDIDQPSRNHDCFDDGFILKVRDHGGIV